MLGEELPLCEEPQGSAPKIFCHFIKIGEGNIDKDPLRIKFAFEENQMKMVEFALGKLPGSSCTAGTARIPPEHIPKSLMGYNHSGT